MSSKIEKRNRPPLSCEPCRNRKLKCNRLMPCDTCVKRNLESNCQYAVNAVRGRPHVSRERALNDRLKRLEESIQSLVREGKVPQTAEQSKDFGTGTQNIDNINKASPTETDAIGNKVQKEIPGTHDRQSQSVYVDPIHWISILGDIKEVRETLWTEDAFSFNESTNDTTSHTEISLAIGSENSSSIDDILMAIPARSICDMLVSHYFNSRYMVLGIVHSGKFQEEYDSFWKEPRQTPVLWIALFLSILSISINLRRKVQPETSLNDSMPSHDTLYEKTAQCLILGGYKTANTYVLEALMLHLQSSFLKEMRINTRHWIDMGLVLRLAFRMGYHRDPTALPSAISPFESEMRRRVWLHIFQLDTLLSFQIGVPSMIPAECCDSQVPRNLFDADMHVKMPRLPPSRPYSDYTPVLYAISKAGVMSIFRKIVAHTISLAPLSYNVTMTLDSEMRGAYTLVPDFLKRRNIDQSLMDSSEVILNRCTIELLYLKGIVILHRRYIRHNQHDAKFESSRRFCVEAALEILTRQADMHRAFQPGGRLQEDQWMLSTLTIYDFLLAAMVICLDISVRLESQSTFRDESGSNEFVSREIVALRTAQQIWAVNSHHSSESRIASLALDLMTRKVAERQATFSFGDESRLVDHAPEVNLELLYMEPISEMIDGTETLDWIILDQYFQNPGFDATQLDSGDNMATLFPDISENTDFLADN